MPGVLLDSSAYIDLEKANKHQQETWAINSLRNLVRSRTTTGKPFLSAISVFEILKGLQKDADLSKAATFRGEAPNDFTLLPFDIPSSYLAAEIAAKLDAKGAGVGIADILIASAAISNDLTLVSSNIEHFQRIVDIGFPLQLINWRQTIS